MERRWAGPQAGCYLLHCAADRRKEREGLGPDSVQERKSPFFSKVFSIFVLQIYFVVLETI
jgi:hypothetical protein